MKKPRRGVIGLALAMLLGAPAIARAALSCNGFIHMTSTRILKDAPSAIIRCGATRDDSQHDTVRSRRSACM